MTTLPSTMEAVRFDSDAGKLSLDAVARPSDPVGDEVLCKVAFAGVCGSDLHMLKGDHKPGIPKIILGHENVGIVAAVGPDVTSVEVGDRVAIEPMQKSCIRCDPCQSKRPNLCNDYGIGSYHGIGMDGGWATYIKLMEVEVYKLADELPLNVGVFIEPYSTILNAYKRIGDIREGAKIWVVGAGIAGLLWASLFHYRGYRDITITQRSETRRKVAKGLGLGFKVMQPREIDEQFKDNDPAVSGYDIIVEASGNQHAMTHALKFMKKAGVFMIYSGYPQDSEVTIDPFRLLFIEGTISTGFLYNHSFQDAIQLVTDMWKDYLDLDKLSVKIFDLQNYEEAIQEMSSKEIVKSVFNIAKAE